MDEFKETLDSIQGYFDVGATTSNLSMSNLYKRKIYDLEADCLVSLRRVKSRFMKSLRGLENTLELSTCGFARSYVGSNRTFTRSVDDRILAHFEENNERADKPIDDPVKIAQAEPADEQDEKDQGKEIKTEDTPIHMKKDSNTKTNRRKSPFRSK